MELHRFRVRNFRSIVDTGWQPFSVDRVTALVGQNESGKSSIIDAAALLFGVGFNPNTDDFRYGTDLPSAYLELSLSDEEKIALVETQTVKSHQDAITKFLTSQQKLSFISSATEGSPRKKRRFSLSEELENELSQLTIVPLGEVVSGDEEASAEFDRDQFIEELWKQIPDFFLFREDRCSLPNRIDLVNGNLDEDAVGWRGANNFLIAADLKVSDIVAADARTLGTLLGRANARITKELQKYWSQYLGNERRITLECELKHYSADTEDKAGKPYLVFWVREGDERLYPSQRSRGTRWFVSFFLQLIAEHKQSPQANVFLLDEPATYLHPSAQEDVIRLVENLAQDSHVVYSTHSPYLLDQRKIHRILGIERIEDDDGYDSRTTIKRGIELATASPLTLAPILGLIGADLSQQDVIKKSRNVVLEEVSARYYLEAFRMLLKEEREFHFVAASGVDNVALLFDLFTAWGLGFLVLVDDDSQGKQVCRALKAKYQLDQEAAARILRRIDGCAGIEEMFSAEDFRSYVCPDFPDGEAEVSAFLKAKKISKPMLAVEFWRKVESGAITAPQISSNTLDKFSALFQATDAAFI